MNRKQNKSMFDFSISKFDLDETVKFLCSWSGPNVFIREDLNAFKNQLLIQGEPSVTACLVRADLIQADGVSVVLGFKLANGWSPPRVTGCDLMIGLLARARQENLRIFLLGAEEAVVDELSRNINRKSPNIIVGSRSGFFEESDYEDICSQILETGADILFIGTPSPKKEKFIVSNLEKLNELKLIMGVGGSFDVLAGRVKRAPELIQKAGLEWLYRIYQEPRRLTKRYIVALSYYFLTVFKQLIASPRNNSDSGDDQ